MSVAALTGAQLKNDAFRRLVESVEDYAIFMLDATGHILTWNRGAEIIKGYRPDEIIGRHFSTFYLDDEIRDGKPARELEIAVREGRYAEEGIRLRKGGGRFWASVVITALRDDAGAVYGFAKVTRDMTERKHAAERLLAEQLARGQAEEAERRATMLADLSARLSDATSVERTLQSVADLLVARIADYVLVDYREGDEQVRRVAVAHRDPARIDLVRQLRRDVVVDDDAHPVAQVLRSGEPLLVAEVSASSGGPPAAVDHPTVRALHPTSFMIVPLTTALPRRVAGTISIVSCQPDRRYGARDLTLAVELAQRSALALDNARLSEEQAAARARAEELHLRLEAVLHQMPAGVAIVEASTGRLLLSNREYERMTGQSSPSAAMMFDADGRAIAPEARPLAQASAQGTITAGAELRILRSDGTDLWVNCNASPIRDPRSGETIAAIATLIETTQRKRAEVGLQVLAAAGAVLASSLDYEATLRHLAASVVPALGDWCSIEMVDEQGKIVPLVAVHRDPEMTQWAREISGRWPSDPASLQGAPAVVRTNKPELYPDIPDELLIAAAQGPEHLAALRKLGMTSALIVPIAANGVVHGVLSLIGAESRRRLTQDDVEVAAELARRAAVAVENAKLYRSVERSQLAALQAVSARDEFLSIASHELKTPLTAMRMSVESARRLLRKPSEESLERAQKKIDSSLRQMDRLETLIKSLLDVSRLTDGRIELTLEQTDLLELAREVSGRFEDQVQQLGGSITVDGADGVVGRWDRSRLDQVITNLISNAMKYGSGRPIHVLVSGSDGSGRLSVSDGGIGIAVEDQVRIFNRFERAVPSQNFGGLGLGLWISRRMVEAMGGAIAVSSRPGAGSTFTVEIPRGNP